jgi:hypothetical protein
MNSVADIERDLGARLVCIRLVRLLTRTWARVVFVDNLEMHCTTHVERRGLLLLFGSKR